ncbi:MAG TPA: hypothetical protein VG755_29980 [Nannocystaceae bacterium]|nr:hypothetical protein [Nannocystaceae bacterium]
MFVAAFAVACDDGDAPGTSSSTSTSGTSTEESTSALACVPIETWPGACGPNGDPDPCGPGQFCAYYGSGVKCLDIPAACVETFCCGCLEEIGFCHECSDDLPSPYGDTCIQL